jgi:hypothetical protein
VLVEARRAAAHRCCTNGTGRGKVSSSLPQSTSEEEVEQGWKQTHRVVLSSSCNRVILGVGGLPALMGSTKYFLAVDSQRTHNKIPAGVELSLGSSF